MWRTAALLFLSLAVFAVACSTAGSADRSSAASGSPSGGQPRTEVVASEATSGAGETVEATVGVAARIKKTGGPSGVPFVARPASGGSSYEADTILAVGYGVHESCELVVLDLGTDDKPAKTVPEWTLMSPKGGGLLRVTLPSLSATGVSDGRFGNDPLKRFYVVRAPEGGMFVDILARRVFTYRVLELSSPARLVVDFKPSGKPLEVPLPKAGGNTVLIEPRAGARIDPPSHRQRLPPQLRGVEHRRPGEFQGEVVARQTVRSNEWISTWGYFDATLDLPPFGRRGTLRVGIESARDGTYKGVEVPIRGR